MLTVGRYTFANALALAPMAGVTDRVFRDICREKGAGMVVGEMLSAKMTLKGSKKAKTQLRIASHDEPEPRIIQLLGNDPDEMAQAAQYNVQQGAQIIDINMGCPAKKVCKKAAGSSLLKDEHLVSEILQAVVQAVDVPVTLKTRLGWSEEHKNIIRISQIAQEAGIQLLTVHGRTREQRFNGVARYELLAEVKRQLDIPLLVNGDIDSPEKARDVLALTQADGLMIGRPAQGNPWIFKEIEHFLATGKHRDRPSLEEQKNTMLTHLVGLHALYGEFSGTKIARKHIGWYFEHLPFSAASLQRFFSLTTPEQQLDFIHTVFDHLPDDMTTSAPAAQTGSISMKPAIMPFVSA